MRTIHFDVQGFSRTYWDFYTGFGLFVTIFLLFAAFLAWQLGGLPAQTLAGMRGITWALALCFVAVTVLSWGYFFIAPVVFSGVVTLCLIAARRGRESGVEAREALEHRRRVGARLTRSG